jgi:hypothetical protein
MAENMQTKHVLIKKQQSKTDKTEIDKTYKDGQV